MKASPLAEEKTLHDFWVFEDAGCKSLKTEKFRTVVERVIRANKFRDFEAAQ